MIEGTMIVDSMTHEEVYKELERDRESMHRWFAHQLDANRRRILKSPKFPVVLWFDHTTPRKNRYLFYCRIFDKHKSKIIVTNVALRSMPDGIAVYMTWPVKNDTIEPMVYLPHVFKQYALPARCNVKKKGVELIKHFLVRNSRGIDSHNQQVVGKSVRHNGQDHLSCCTDEGILLGHMEGNIYVANTFITYEMCGIAQKKEFEPKRDNIPTDFDIYEAEKLHKL